MAPYCSGQSVQRSVLPSQLAPVMARVGIWRSCHGGGGSRGRDLSLAIPREKSQAPHQRGIGRAEGASALAKPMQRRRSATAARDRAAAGRSCRRRSRRRSGSSPSRAWAAMTSGVVGRPVQTVGPSPSAISLRSRPACGSALRTMTLIAPALGVPARADQHPFARQQAASMSHAPAPATAPRARSRDAPLSSRPSRQPSCVSARQRDITVCARSPGRSATGRQPAVKDSQRSQRRRIGHDGAGARPDRLVAQRDPCVRTALPSSCTRMPGPSRDRDRHSAPAPSAASAARSVGLDR